MIRKFGNKEQKSKNIENNNKYKLFKNVGDSYDLHVYIDETNLDYLMTNNINYDFIIETLNKTRNNNQILSNSNCKIINFSVYDDIYDKKYYNRVISYDVQFE